ncbi:Pyoverdine/dityrosine biosynthesis protein-domain-containing protein [Boeremia exigua]|uniref:Pyoverdine/dityrosine biosynthesis protein-domain-containing protein n=1 Tax=Boeremia exigua TaxID=749465 RepID=UPI001E8E22DA|nr:Pyoverdine/dityrosine biosynthesis protein-domain-containing protein [Boeremia exigua]KAH6616647.1 Pyoverdine/dityrosine biosynthesis protein-domain-containing protein [Boeremia exigua]
METSQRILDVILRYKSPIPKNSPNRGDEGALKFLGLIYRSVKNNETVRMVLPAFPFKSPNSSVKVLGTLPDKAEDIALAHLNGLCAAIEDIYSPGAVLTIVSDGLVYNDLLGVSDQTVWTYGQSLRQLTKTKGYTHIEFARLKDLLGIASLRDDVDEMTYAATAPSIRLALMQRYGTINWDAITNESYVNNDENKRLTYCGYLKFLALDLADTYPIGPERTKSAFKRGVETIAKSMLKRGEAFARAVRENYSDHVRLSIHPSTGEDKISINVLPVEKVLTPWHSTIAIKVDGTVLAGQRQSFEEDTNMELVSENGRPSYFRERSDFYQWDCPAPVTFEPMYPCGIMIRPSEKSKRLSIQDVDGQKVRQLAEANSPVILRGFAQTKNRDAYVAKSYEMGVPTPWKFGLVLEVKDRGAEGQGLNNVLSQEWMPFHFDGLFKTEKRTRDDGSEYLVPNPPRFQYFAAVTPSPKNTGYTLFSSSKLLFDHLPMDKPLEHLKSLTWSVKTRSFDQSIIDGMPLVVTHPSTGRPCLKFHERWPQEKTRFDPTEVVIENGDESVCDVLESLLHDRRVCYWHSWLEGDLIVNDNISMLHTRSSFQAGVDRELWRIHFD